MSKPGSTKKPSTVQSTPTQDQPSGPNQTQPYCLLKTGTAKKISKQAAGGVGYQVVNDVERQALFIRITSNSGGYFSREFVSVEKNYNLPQPSGERCDVPDEAAAPSFYWQEYM